MPDIKIVQPEELNTNDFVFENGQFKLAKPQVSVQDQNKLQVGTDGGAFLANDQLKRYRILPDNATSSLLFYEYYGDYFDVSTAVLLDSISMATVSIEIDDIAISGSVLTFKDVQTNQELSFDTALPIYQVAYQASQSVSITGDGKHSPLVVDLVLDPDSNNLLKVSTSGVMVNAEDILSLFNRRIEESMELKNDIDTGNLVLKVGDTTLQVATSRLVNSSGTVIGYVLT